MNLMPLVSSNLWSARIRPRWPSLIKSESETPWFWYFLATETTNRRFERTSSSSASASLCLIRWASVTSSSRVIKGYWLISRRYWSSDPSSNEARFAVFSCMAESPSRRARRRRTRLRTPVAGSYRIIDPSRCQRISVSQGSASRASRSRSEEHTSELQSPCNLVCRLLLEKKNILIEIKWYQRASIYNTQSTSICL